jgi:hypothetical protein
MADEVNRGRVVLTRRQGDTVHLSIDGREVGVVEFLRVPHDAKVSVAFTFDRSIGIMRGELTAASAAETETTDG